jgi:hypothetical protein
MSEPKACAASRMFRVNNIESFVEGLNQVEGLNVQIVETTENPNDPKVYLYSDDGFWPTEIFDGPIEVREELEAAFAGPPEPGEAIEGVRAFDVVDYVSGHLKEGEIAIFEQVSFQGIDSLAAISQAVNPAGKRISYSLDDFADRAVEELGGNRDNL